jgi:hypothetical protein
MKILLKMTECSSYAGPILGTSHQLWSTFTILQGGGEDHTHYPDEENRSTEKLSHLLEASQLGNGLGYNPMLFTTTLPFMENLEATSMHRPSPNITISCRILRQIQFASHTHLTVIKHSQNNKGSDRHSGSHLKSLVLGGGHREDCGLILTRTKI